MFIKLLSLALLSWTGMANAAELVNYTVLPTSPISVKLERTDVAEAPALELKSGTACRLTNETSGTLRWRAIALTSDNLKPNTFQVFAVEFSAGCYLFFSRQFDRHNLNAPSKPLLTGVFGVSDEGSLAVDYSSYGANPARQAERLVQIMSGEPTQPRLTTLPLAIELTE